MDFGISTSSERSNQIGMASNFMDHTPSGQIKKITGQQYSDLPSLLASVGLEKYNRKFNEENYLIITTIIRLYYLM